MSMCPIAVQSNIALFLSYMRDATVFIGSTEDVSNTIAELADIHVTNEPPATVSGWMFFLFPCFATVHWSKLIERRKHGCACQLARERSLER